MLAFTEHKAFEKAGRFWIYDRIYEHGFLRKQPVVAIQKSYGQIPDGSKVLVRRHFEQLFKEHTGSSCRMESNYSISGFHVSPNVKTMASSSHSNAPGYFDQQCSYILYKKLDNSTVIFPFKDMLDLDGNVSNITSFHQESNSSNYYGALEANIYEVTCAFSGDTVLDVDAVEIDGLWYAKSILQYFINPQAFPPSIKRTEVLEDNIETEDLSDIDVEDF
jgi:hypothetical protein